MNTLPRSYVVGTALRLGVTTCGSGALTGSQPFACSPAARRQRTSATRLAERPSRVPSNIDPSRRRRLGLSSSGRCSARHSSSDISASLRASVTAPLSTTGR